MVAQLESSGLRSKVMDALSEYEAILFFCGALDARAIDEIAGLRRSIERMARSELRANLKNVEKTVQRWRGELSVRGAGRELVDFYVESVGEFESKLRQSHLPLAHAYLSYSRIERYFPNYGKQMLSVEALPVHARVGIPLPPQQTALDVFLPEAALFENVAVLFNECDDLFRDSTTYLEQVKLKRARAFLHSCYSTTQHFVEAYLNGIAFDFASRNAGRLAEKDFQALLEFDLAKERPKQISLRDKILQYPRILTGSAHPPLTEANSPEIDILIGEGKAFRDAIVHATPRPSVEKLKKISKAIETGEEAALLARERGEMDREGYLLQTDFESLTRVVDAAISLVLRIEGLVDGYMLRMRYIVARGSDGRFPASLFDTDMSTQDPDVGGR